MSDGWQKDDLALCIHDGRWISPEGHGIWDGGPQRGQVFTVVEIEMLEQIRGGVGLVLDKYPDDSFAAVHFRKITPEKADAFDRETIAMLNGKPVREMA